MLFVIGRQGDRATGSVFGLPFDGTLLWVTICILGVINTRREVFLGESFGSYEKETLSVDSNLNESTSLW